MADTPKDRDALVDFVSINMASEVEAGEPTTLRSLAAAALTALEAAGLAVVPVDISDDALFEEPVCEWLNRHYAPGHIAISRPMLKGAYRAMVAASPYTSKPGGDHA